MVVYCRRNKENGKVYIGKTTGDEKTRWYWMIKEALETNSNTKICKAIRKYTPSAFESAVLYKARTLEELNKMERVFIILHQSHLDENGYNMTLGGDGGATLTGRKRPPEVGQKIGTTLRERAKKFSRRGIGGFRWKVGEQSREHKLKNRLANIRAPRFRICYSCFKPFDSKDNLRRVFCSQFCYWNLLRTRSKNGYSS